MYSIWFFEVHKPWIRLCCLWMRFWYMVILHTKCMAHVALILHAYWCAWDACSSCQTHNAMLFALLWHGWLMFWICFMHLVLYMDTTTKQPKRNLISSNFNIFYHFWSCVNRTKACSKYMLFTTYFCIFGCLIPSYSADLLEKPKACEVGHVRKNPCTHERLRK